MDTDARPDSESLRTLVVDDHESARQKLLKLLSPHPWIDLVGEAGTGIEAVELALALRPDVLFLDIQMPSLDGFEVLEQLHLHGMFPHVIFVTAFDEFAIKAFDVHAVDYLVKPVNRGRFDLALQKLRRHHDPTPAALLSYYRQHTKAKRKLLVKSGQRFELIAWDEIQLIMSDNDLAEIFTTKTSYLSDQSLDSLEEFLPDDEFYRVHRATICRITLIKNLITDGQGHYHLDYDHSEHSQIVVSRRRYGALKKFLTARR